MNDYELKLRDEIAVAFLSEQQKIDAEIKELQRRRCELGKIKKESISIGIRSYRLGQIKGANAARDFCAEMDGGKKLTARILNLRGYCELYSELERRHVDQWVKLIPLK